MSDTRPKSRLFVESDLMAGAALDLTEGQARHLGQALRLKPGDMVALFNGRDGEWLAAISTLAKGRGRVETLEMLRPQRQDAGPWLAFAPLKKTATDFVVEKATELGAGRLIPVFTRHTAAGRVNIERLRANAIEAAQQTERMDLPEVMDAVDLASLLDDWPPERRLLMADESGGGPPLAEALVEGGSDVGFLIGPEGGFSPPEIEMLARMPFIERVGLGPRILRAETAAIAALACFQAIRGDWNQAPSPRFLHLHDT